MMVTPLTESSNHASYHQAEIFFSKDNDSTHWELKARDSDARRCRCAGQADEVARTGGDCKDNDEL